MHASAVTPTGVERTFGRDEIIVSKTDGKGRITYANQVFLRVARLDEAAVIGKPHNLIRHPQMPRVVFKLLWDTVLRGEEIFAYVKNLAADGAHYWVLAHVAPAHADGGEAGGFHSNRRSPGRGAVRDMDALYRDLHEIERRHARPADAMAASGAALEAVLAGRGQTYDQFVWSVIDNDGTGA